MATNSLEAQLRQVIIQLHAYEQQVKDVADQVLAAHAQEVADLAKQLSPVRTGFNRDHIEAVKLDYQKYKVAANSPYAIDLELGTSRMAATPFLFPATEALRNALRGRLLAALKNG